VKKESNDDINASAL